MSSAVLLPASALAQNPVATLKWESGDPVTNFVKIAGTNQYTMIVQICSPNQITGFTTTLSNAAGSSSLTMSDGASANCPNGGSAWFVDVTLAPELNTIAMYASDNQSNITNVSAYLVYVPANRAKVEAPAEGGIRLPPGLVQVLPFTITNSGTASNAFNVTVSCSGPVSNCKQVAANATSFSTGTLAPGAFQVHDITVTAGTAEGSASLTLIAVPAGQSQYSDTALTPILISRASPPNAITAKGRDTVSVAPNTTAQRALFTVRNPDPFASRTVSLTATCGTLTSCAVSPSSVSVGAGSDTLIAVTFNVPSSPSTQVTKVVLTSTVSSPSGTSKDSSYIKVGTLPSTIVSVDVASLNSGPSVARDQCLSISAGAGAAIECGALRIVQGLPGVRTLGVERAPSLTYLSDHGYPFSRVGVSVSVKYLSTNAAPDSVRANLIVASPAANVYIAWPWSPQCATAEGCRLTVPFITWAYGLGTGLHDYTIQIRIGAGGPIGTATGSLVTIDNRSSAFGQGWWLEGHERLFTVSSTKMLWIGGDGSSRVYNRQSDTTVWTVSEKVTRPDTLKRESTQWNRRLRNGGVVQFDASLRHIATINRQGHLTRFYYNSTSSRLDSIALPVPASQPSKLFEFIYNAASPARVTAIKGPSPTGSGTRDVNLLYDAYGHLTQLKEPSGDSVKYVYHPYTTTGVIDGRINRTSDTTTFYHDGWGSIRKVEVGMRGAATLTTLLCPTEARSVFACSVDGSGYRPQAPSRVNTLIDGPRADVADVTRFGVNRFGGPDAITDAMGATVRLKRENSTFPALVTEMTDAAGLVTRTAYNSRGLPDSVTVVAPYGASNAVSRFKWHTKWDMTVSMRSPTSEVDSIWIDNTTGNRTWQRRGTHDSTKVSFSYDGLHRLTGVSTQAIGTVQTLTYDAVRGNVATSQSALGYLTEFASDHIGRDTSVWTPIDGTLKLRNRAVYDIMGRTVRTETIAPAIYWSLSPVAGGSGTAPTRTQVVKTEYDREGRVLSVLRFTAPDSTSGKVAKTWMTYDAAGRVVTKGELHTEGSESMAYDAAGNLTSSTSRRGHTVRQTYDAVNRVVARTSPSLSSAREVCWECNIYGYFTNPDTVFIPTIGSRIDSYQGRSSLVIPAEVTNFGYDAAGRMVQADNPFARIRRGYFANGALRADTTWVRRYDPDQIDPFPTADRSVLTYAYDLSGRRTSRGDHRTGTQTYAYDGLGQLASTTDQATYGGATVSINFQYDAMGQLRKQSVPVTGDTITSAWQYDYEGRPIVRIEEGFTDSLFYDQRGKRTRVVGKPVMTDYGITGTVVRYDGLGQVIATANTDTERPAVTDELVLDGSGNTLIRHGNKLGGALNAESRDSSVYMGHLLKSRTGAHFPDGRVNPADGFSAAIPMVDSLGITYDSSGNVVSQVVARREWLWGQSNGFSRRDSLGHTLTWNWYDATERLRYTQQTTSPASFAFHTRLSEYRYDALGRRIAVRSQVDSAANCASATVVTPITCQQDYTVTTWDGDQVLLESRSLGAWQLSDVQVGTPAWGDWWGTVRHTQTGAIDAAIVVWKDDGTPRILHRNWRGNVAGATLASNGTTDAGTIWPAAITDVFYAPDGRQSAPTPNKWLGSIVSDGRDATGTLYRRNRYYDPATGRFTQQDPIGLAGGLNLYGYGNGDPFNNSDPFGLCPPEDDNTGDCQKSKDGSTRAAYCPRGSSGSPPNCTNAQSGAAVGGSCPNVSGQEWDLGQRAVALSTATPGLEYGFAITGSGVVDGRDAGAVPVPPTESTPAKLIWTRGYPRGTKTAVHSHPSGNGLSGGDVSVGKQTNTRQVSAGVGTNVYGSWSPGGSATNCNVGSRP